MPLDEIAKGVLKSAPSIVLTILLLVTTIRLYSDVAPLTDAAYDWSGYDGDKNTYCNASSVEADDNTANEVIAQRAAAGDLDDAVFGKMDFGPLVLGCTVLACLHLAVNVLLESLGEWDKEDPNKRGAIPTDIFKGLAKLVRLHELVLVILVPLALSEVANAQTTFKNNCGDELNDELDLDVKMVMLSSLYLLVAVIARKQLLEEGLGQLICTRSVSSNYNTVSRSRV